MAKAMCVLYPVDETGVYLGRKKKKIGAGSLNGCGGKPEGAENIVTAMIREAYEEWGIRVKASDLKLGAMFCISREGVGHEVDLYVFTVTKWEGEFTETDEMGLPEHYSFSKMPFDQMMVADHEWLEAVFFGQLIKGSFCYNPDRTAYSDFKMNRVEAFA
jgi:8-oxo-dGTP pyrophosphatase MutT (NUDIX family)